MERRAKIFGNLYFLFLLVIGATIPILLIGKVDGIYKIIGMIILSIFSGILFLLLITNLREAFRPKIKKKTITTLKKYFDKLSLLPINDIKTAGSLIVHINTIISAIEEYADKNESEFQNRLKKEELLLDILRAEILILLYRFIDHHASKTKINPEIGSIIYTVMLDYIDSLSIKFPTNDFQNSQDFFEERLLLYSEFLILFLSNEKEDINNCMQWLLDVLSMSPLKKRKTLNLNGFRPINTDINSTIAFNNFLLLELIPKMEDMVSCLKETE
jgi:hypothetical protein